jgi:hypothetical protein
MVAYVHGNIVAHSWHLSLMELLGYDLGLHGRLFRGGWLGMRKGTDSLAEARNRVVEQFLDDSAAEWLWWLDTDMGFQPDTLERLLDAADPTDRPMVGALCFVQREMVSDGMGGYRCQPAPTLYDWIGTDDGARGFVGRASFPVNTLVRVAGTGAACVLVHRSVFERVQAEHGPVWYDRVANPTTGGQLMGEDLSFCLRAGAVGVPIHVHTGIRTSHLKDVWLAEPDYWAQAVPPPATAETAVIVPVLGRPEHAEPFMASLRASTGLATCYAVCDEADTEAALAWKQAGAEVLVWGGDGDRPGTFAEKVNYGYAYTDEPWLFLVGSDVQFHPGWLDHAQAVAGDSYHVVGTNDLGNPRVTSGEHATHLLVRRSYVDEVGASWDGPGILCHEGYRHWYVDNEIVTAAKQRGVWAMALASKVEHLHPLFGKGDDDEVYRIGQAHAPTDKATFERRARENRP